jgi:hypothetical protein
MWGELVGSLEDGFLPHFGVNSGQFTPNPNARRVQGPLPGQMARRESICFFG